MNARLNFSSRYHAQQGVVLVVALVMLVLVTLVGLTSIRTITLEERMAANSVDRNLAFQAAETALREGEAVADAQSLNANGPNNAFTGPAQTAACATTHCVNGMCNLPHPSCRDAWELLPNPIDWAPALTVHTALAGNDPRYLVEFLGNTFPCDPGNAASPSNCKRYRITARAQPGEGRALVMLQSIYAAE